MRFQTVSDHLSIREQRKEVRFDVVGERPAVGRVRRLAPWLIRQHVRQLGRCHPRCFLWRVPTRVLQRVREDGDESRILRRLRGKIRSFLVAGEEGYLRGASVSVRLSVTSGCAIQSAGPQR